MTKALQRFIASATILSAFLLFCMPAYACVLQAERNLHDIKFADVVLVGRISNYAVIRDEEFRQKLRDRLLTQLSRTDLTPDERKFNENMLAAYDGPGGILTDYARFDIEVEEVLSGKVEKLISVTWGNSTFGEPKEMDAGPFLFGLIWPSSQLPPLRGPSATVVRSRQPHSLTVLQAPCAAPFIFKSESKEALEVRERLRAN